MLRWTLSSTPYGTKVTNKLMDFGLFTRGLGDSPYPCNEATNRKISA